MPFRFNNPQNVDANIARLTTRISAYNRALGQRRQLFNYMNLPDKDGDYDALLLSIGRVIDECEETRDALQKKNTRFTAYDKAISKRLRLNKLKKVRDIKSDIDGVICTIIRYTEDFEDVCGDAKIFFY